MSGEQGKKNTYTPPQTADTLPGKAKDAVAELTGQTEEEFPEKSATFMEQVAEQTGRYVQQFKDALTSSGKTAQDEAGKVGTTVTKGWSKEKEDAETEPASETTAVESASDKPKIAEDEVLKAPEEKNIA